jgi:C4-dicarboxylate transporter, DctM subunit
MIWQTGIVLFGVFAALILLEFPIALALGISAITVIGVFHIVSFDLVPQLMFGTADSFTLLAIPFFIFTGIVLGRTSLSKRLIDLAACFVGDVPGGLGIVGIIAAVFFAGISGSGPADVAALGLILIPAMTAAGYDRNFSAALTAASGGIGIIVPPSIALIIYGFVAEVSISRLFLAGILPGIVVAFSLIAATVGISYKRGFRPRRETRMPLGTAFRRAIWGLLAPVIILGGIYGGVFTPTEAAAVAVVYSILVDMLLYKTMNVREMLKVAAEAGAASAAIMSILVCASLFAWVLNTQGLAAELASRMIALTTQRWLLLLIINGVLLVAGLFLDAISIFYIFLPILLPVVNTIGVDPVHFGIIMTVNLAIGQVTPPVGINLAAASGVSGAGIKDIAISVVPFVAAECAALLVITYIPGISLIIPSLIP